MTVEIELGKISYTLVMLNEVLGATEAGTCLKTW